ncbi:MAG: hypothetical protein O2815_07000, partial [Actinomycetota bacterium]|nr:hypothetical protein [Actinomycetota bacterium]
MTDLTGAPRSAQDLCPKRLISLSRLGFCCSTFQSPSNRIKRFAPYGVENGALKMSRDYASVG